MFRIHIIGAGRVGKTLAKLFNINQIAAIGGIVNTSLENALEAVRFIGKGTAYETVETLPGADIYFITTYDDAIQTTCEQLAKNTALKNAIVVHCSGLLSSEVLSSVKPLGCVTASIHPIKSFARPAESVNSFAGTYCAIEGDQQAVTALTPLFEAIGGKIFQVKKENKSLYHAACVMANNYLVTLHHQALQCFQTSAIEGTIAKELVSTLMMNSLTNLKKLNHHEALTGPLQRGDTQTIKLHLDSLAHLPLIRESYLQLGLATLPLTRHTEEKLAELQETLTSLRRSGS